MSKENYQWLEKELPSWVKEGIVSQEGAKALLARYQDEKKLGSASGMAFSLLGFALVGLGIISLLAYNWDQLGHMERTILALLLLVGAQLFAFGVKYFRPQDKALLEGSGVLWFLMVGASLAIIGQTYHLGGSTLDFLSIWLLLSFGIVFLMPSSGVAFFQIFLWTMVWIMNRNDFTTLMDMGSNHSLNVWILILFALAWLAYYGWRLKEAKDANGTMLLSWGLAVCLLAIFSVEVVIYARFARNLGHTLILGALFCAIFYLAGMLYLSHGEKTWQRPFERIGKLGAFLLLLSHVSFASWKWMAKPFSYIDQPEYHGWLLWILVILFLALVGFLVRTAKQVPSESLVILTPLIFWVYNILQSQPETSHYEAMILLNASLLAGASWMIYCGAKEAKIGLVNQGMILIALGVWIHFMDAKFDLVAKGVAFIVTGMFFLAMNAMARRYFKAKA